MIQSKGLNRGISVRMQPCLGEIQPRFARFIDRAERGRTPPLELQTSDLILFFTQRMH